MDPLLTRRTYRYELLRAISQGVIETGPTTFLLLIAVQAFAAEPMTKALVAAGGSVGLLLTPVTVSVVSRIRWTTSRAAASLAGFGGVCFLVAALAPTLPVFVAASILASAAGASVIPLYTQMYQENYPTAERGRRFAASVMVRVAVAALFSWLAGRALSGRIEDFPGLLGVYAAAFVFSAFCLGRCPTRVLVEDDGSRHPFRALRHVRDDRLFRITLISWMFMGLGNLLMLPLRVEYLANPRYGLELPAETIALLTGTVPCAMRLLLAPIWGRLFDRMNFFLLRIVLNLGFMAGIVAFFVGETMPWLIVGSVVFGFANAGGDVAWSLWVTKIAPPERVADYMSVHTFLTGVRSLAAPFLAFTLASRFSLPTIGWGAAGLIVIACALLVPEYRQRADRRLAATG